LATILRFRPRKRRPAKRGPAEGQPSLFEGFPYTPEADLHMRPADGTDARSVPLPSDAEPLDRAELGENAPPEVVKKQVRKRRTFRVAMIAVFLGGAAATVFGEKGWIDVQRRQGELERLRAEAAAQQERVDALRREVSRLRTDPAAIERIAREELGYALPGEVTLLLPRSAEVEPAGGSATVRPYEPKP
jgi:cell division protein FtsB